MFVEQRSPMRSIEILWNAVLVVFSVHFGEANRNTTFLLSVAQSRPRLWTMVCLLVLQSRLRSVVCFVVKLLNYNIHHFETQMWSARSRKNVSSLAHEMGGQATKQLLAFSLLTLKVTKDTAITQYDIFNLQTIISILLCLYCWKVTWKWYTKYNELLQYCSFNLQSFFTFGTCWEWSLDQRMKTFLTTRWARNGKG